MVFEYHIVWTKDFLTSNYLVEKIKKNYTSNSYLLITDKPFKMEKNIIVIIFFLVSLVDCKKESIIIMKYAHYFNYKKIYVRGK